MVARVFASGDVYEAGKRLRGIRLREEAQRERPLLSEIAREKK